jgi:hypothetical protein
MRNYFERLKERLKIYKKVKNISMFDCIINERS